MATGLEAGLYGSSAPFWDQRTELGPLCRKLPLSRCGWAGHAMGPFPCHSVTAASNPKTDFLFKQKGWDKPFNSSLWCWGYFKLSCVKCFPVLKNDLKFG